MASVSFLGQLSYLLWIVFLAIAMGRMLIALKDSRIFTQKN